MPLTKVVSQVSNKVYPRQHGIFILFQKTLLYIEDLINRLVSPRLNPFYYLGAISSIFFLALLISGIYLFIFYRTNNPYQTVQNLTEKQWYIGGIMRSIHRYSSDGLMVSLILHFIREFFYGRYVNNRWLAWVSGIFLFGLTLIIGIIGYWLVWDERAQLIALKTSELLSDIPLSIEPLSRSFISSEVFNAMLLYLLHLIHLSIPLAMVIIIGIHVLRCSRPVLKPPLAITRAILVILLLLSIISPAISAPPADLTRLPVNPPFDWFYLFIYPLKDMVTKNIFWFFTTGLTAILFLTPWIRRYRPPSPQVISKNCIGCDQCNRDCPYGAIRLQPRPDISPFKMEAVVIPKRCASCGICVGACDFNAINLPDITYSQLKGNIIKLLSSMTGIDRPKILLFICEQSIRFNNIIESETESLKGMANVKLVTLPCIGMVQPSMIEAGFMAGADGVFLCGCTIGDCHYRKGNIWLQARLNDQRSPGFKRTVYSGRIREYWLSPIRIDKLMKELHLFEEDLNGHSIKSNEDTKITMRKTVFSAVFLILLPTILLFFLSAKPTYPFYSKDRALIKFTFKHSGKQLECRELTEDDTKTELKHMRKTISPFSKIRTECERKRLPTYVELDLDNRNIFSRTYYPTGFKKDGPTFAYEEIPASPGIHEIKVRIKDSLEGNSFDYIIEKKINAIPGKVTLIDLSSVFSVEDPTPMGVPST
jgi:quinol-cytochrome oxidoreductase complex cytochrome b subunit/coenzyme F420-reducing hydrogenase delta subunit